MKCILLATLWSLTSAFDHIDFFGFTSHATIGVPPSILTGNPSHVHHHTMSDIAFARYRRTIDDNGFQSLSIMYAASGFMVSFTLITAFLFVVAFLENNEIYFPSTRFDDGLLDEEIALLSSEGRLSAKHSRLDACRL